MFPTTPAAWLLAAIGLYLITGLFVGGFGLLRLAPRADPALRASGRSIRVLLLSGAVAVWPVAVWRWWSAMGAPRAEPGGTL